jgi:cytochrome c oxidase assembly protein subunit 15
MGTVVGMLAIALTFSAWKTEPRRWVRWLATAVLGAVILQGVVGGLRVVLVELNLAVVHACFAQAFFCLAALVAVVTSRWWVEADDRDTGAAAGRGLALFAAVAVVVVYLQLVAGALMRHYGAGLAIPDLPLAYGRLLPPVTAEGLRLANESRVWEAGLARVTLGQVWLHFAHRVGAVVVAVAVVAAALRVLRRHRRPGLTGPAVLMLVLLAAQVTLGGLTVLYRKPADVASAHVATGALLLVTTFVLAARAARLFLPGARAARPAESTGFDLSSAKLATA